MEDSRHSLVIADAAPMMMSPAIRRLSLTVHLTFSVGWLGAVAAFLALAIVGVTSPNDQLVRGAYLATWSITWYVIIPMCIAALLTGIVQSLGTPWGLFRHYWVVAKLGLTVVATALLLLHTGPIAEVAGFAAGSTLAYADPRPIRLQLIGDAAAALFVLFLTTVLSVYKPWGPTPLGTDEAIARRSRMVGGRFRVVIVLAVIVLVAFLLLHAQGISPGGH